MATQLDICNLALDAIGTRSTISSLTENSAEANACARHYTIGLAAMLASAHWSFARAQITLSLIADATQGQAVPAPWLYEYAMPTDCVRMRKILPMFDNVPGVNPSGQSVVSFMGPPVMFLMASDKDANGNDINVLLCNQSQAIAVYTKLVTNTLLFTAEFVEGFVLYLAHRIATPLTGDKQLSMALFQEADAMTKRARASNQNEGLTIIDQVPDWMRVRGYAGDFAYPPGSAGDYGPQNLVMVS